jgi:hypothetical protein
MSKETWGKVSEFIEKKIHQWRDEECTWMNISGIPLVDGCK